MARTRQIRKYIIPLSAVLEMQSHLEANKAQVVMRNIMMRRTLFGIQTEGWVRVRVGDVGIDGQTISAITFKKVTSAADEKSEFVIELEVSDYDEAVELLEMIGCTRRSEQETIRTKYLYDHNGGNFIVTVDRWPWLDEFRLVTVESILGVEPGVMDDFGAWLKVVGHEAYKGGVDEAYQKTLGFAISDCADARFTAPQPQRSNES